MEKGENTGTRRIRFHWKNLYKIEHPEARLSALRNGRAWLHLGEAIFGVQWVTGKFRLGAGITIGDSTHQLSGFIGCAFFSFYWYVDGVAWLANYINEHNTRELSIRVFDHAVWWHFWSHPHEWNGKDHTWRTGHIGLADVCSRVRALWKRCREGEVPL